MAVCVDPNCKPHMKGEVVPIIVEVNSETEARFEVIDNIKRTYCEVKTTSGEPVSIQPVKIQVLTDIKKQVYCSWDTSKLDVGYYILRFWIGVNLFGTEDGNGDLIEDFRLASPEIKRYIKAE